MSNTLRNLMSRGGLSFAHLGRSQARASDNEDPPADDDSGKGKKGKRAEDDDPNDQNRDDGDSKKGKRADNDSSDDDDDDNEDGEVDDDGKGSGKKGNKAKRADDDDSGEDPEAEDDDDDEEEMRGKSASAKARRRERARCAAIFACKAAGRNPELAAALAFESTMTRQEAIAVLNKTRAPAGSGPVRRNPSLGAGGDQSISSSDAVAQSWDVAFQRAGAKRTGRN